MIGNACKYSERSRADGSDSGITVTVRCVVVGGRKVIEFGVQDASAHRFSPIELKALYSRPVNFKREAVGGMGTGMCCLAARVKALGGDCGARLRADNLPGTVVWFRTPFDEPCEPTPLSPHTPLTPLTPNLTLTPHGPPSPDV